MILLVLIPPSFTDGLDHIKQRLHEQISPSLLKVTYDLLHQHHNPANSDFSFEDSDDQLYTEEPIELKSPKFDPYLSPSVANRSHHDTIDSSLFSLPPIFEPLARSRRSVPTSQLNFDQPEDPPTLNAAPDSFMHSFVTGSGIGNRELIRITSIAEHPLQVETPQPPLGWQYSRFNSSDYVACRQQQHVHVWRQQFPAGSHGFRFDHSKSICHVHVSSPASILQTLFYTRVLQDEELLHLAVTLRIADGSYQLRTYELVARGSCIPSLTVELGLTPPIRIAHVRSHYFGALAVLLDGAPRGTPLVSRLQKGRETSANILAVRAHQAVDLEPFHMHGFAYLAVAHASGVDVFKLDEFLQRHQAYDSVALSGVRDVLAFKSGVEQHLAIATNSVHQHILVWRDGSFVRQQVLPVANVLQWLPLHVHSCRDDLFVGLLRNDPAAPLLLYQYQTTNRRLQLESDSMARHLRSPMQPLPFTQATFSYNSTSFLLQPDAGGFTRLVAFETTLQQLPDPLFDRQFQLSNFVRSLHARLSAQQTALRSVRDTLNHAVGAFGRLPAVHIPLHIRQLRSSKAVLADEISQVRSAHWQGTSLTLADTQADLRRLRTRLATARSHARSLIDRLRAKAIWLQSPTAQLAGRKRFIGRIHLNTLFARALDLPVVANHSMINLVHDLWLRDQSNPRVTGLKRFVQPPLVTGRLDSSLFNSFPSMFNLALDVNQPITIESPVEFTGDLKTKHLHIDSRLNRLNVSNDLIYIDGTPQSISAPIRFSAPLVTVHRLHTPSINQIDVLAVRQQSLTTDTRQLIFTPLRLNRLSLDVPVTVRNQINHFDIGYFVESLVRQDRPTQLIGSKVFSQSLQVNDLRLSGPLNRILIPSQLVSSARPQDITGRKSIASATFRNHLTVNRTLNGFRYPVDVVTISNHEQIDSPIIISHGFSSARNVLVNGLTDGIQLAKFARYMDRREMVLFGHTRFQGPVHVRGHFTVDGLVAGHNITLLAQQLVRHDDPIFSVTGRKHFEAPVTLNGGLVVPVINHLPTKQLIDISSENVITTPLHLRSANFQQLFVKDRRINDLDLMELLTDRISLHLPGSIAGNKRFASINVDTLLRVHGTVNGLNPPSDFVFLHPLPSNDNNIPRITGPIHFNVDLHLLGITHIENLTLNGRLNRVNVSQLIRNRIPLDRESLLPGPVVLLDSGASSLQLNHEQLWNGASFDRMVSNWMRKDVPQVITGCKQFVRPIRFVGPTKLNILNGQLTERLSHATLRSHSDQQTIDANVIVAGPLRVAGSIWTRHGLNGVRLDLLQQDTPLATAPVHFSAPCQLLHGIRIEQSLTVSRLNHLHLPDDLLLLSGDQHVRGHVTFDHLSVAGSVRSQSGLINHVSIGQLERDAVRSDRPNVLAGDVYIDQQTFAYGDVKLRGRLTNVNLTRLTSFALNRRADQHLQHVSVSREALTTFAQLNVQQVNGIDWSAFVRDVVLKNGLEPQDLGTSKHFRRIQLQGAYRLPALNATCRVNNIDLVDLARHRILLRSKQPIRLPQPVVFGKRAFFNSHFRIAQRLNGVRLHDVLQLNTDAASQVVTGQWYLTKAQFGQSIWLNGSFNGRSMRQLISTTLFRQGDQHIAGTRHLQQALNLHSGLELNALNGRPLLWQQVPFVRFDTIGALPVRFMQPLHIQTDLNVTGRIDAVNVNEWVDNLLHRSGLQKSNAHMQMDSVAVQGHFWPQSTVNGIDLSAFLARLNQFEGTLNNGSVWLKQQMAKQLQLSRDLLMYVRRSTLQLQTFELAQRLPSLYGQQVSADPLGVFDARLGFQPLQFDSNPSIAGGRFLPLSSTTSLQRRNVSNEKDAFDNQLHYMKRHLPSNQPQSSGSIQLYMPPAGREQQVLLKQADTELFSFGNDVDLVRHLQLTDGSTLIAALSGISGKLNLYMLSNLRSTTGRPLVRQIGNLVVGSEATDFALFELDEQIHIAVARSYGHLCPINDFGTLLFRWQDRVSFQLVQRIPIADATLIQYVQFNDNDYLVIYEADPPGDDQLLSGRIHLYRQKSDSNRCQFTLMQQIFAPHLKHLNVFAFGPSDRLQLFVLGISSSRLSLWKYQGHSGLELSWTTDLVDGDTVRPLLLNQQLYLLVTQQQSCSGSRVYRALTSGATQFPLQLHVASDGLPAQWSAVSTASN